jgi:hypothetical protein
MFIDLSMFTLLIQVDPAVENERGRTGHQHIT